MSISIMRQKVENGEYYTSLPQASPPCGIEYDLQEQSYMQDTIRLFEFFKKDLFEVTDMTHHSKAERCLQFACEENDNRGHLEIFDFFVKLVQILKD